MRTLCRKICEKRRLNNESPDMILLSVEKRPVLEGITNEVLTRLTELCYNNNHERKKNNDSNEILKVKEEQEIVPRKAHPSQASINSDFQVRIVKCSHCIDL